MNNHSMYDEKKSKEWIKNCLSLIASLQRFQVNIQHLNINELQ